MRKKINLGRIDTSKKAINKQNHELLDKLYKYLKYQRGQSDQTIHNTMTYARALLNRYGDVECSAEMGERLWRDWEAEGAVEQTICHVLHTLELMAACQNIELKLKKPKLPIKEVNYLSLPELRAVLNAANNRRDAAVLHTLFYCGVRASELCRLTLEDVDLLGRRLYIRGKTKSRRERIVIMCQRRHKFPLFRRLKIPQIKYLVMVFRAY